MSQRATAVFTASFLTVTAHYGIRYTYGTLLPEMLPALDISKAQAGAIYSSYFIAYTIFSPLIGRLSDRFDTRIILTVFSLLMGTGAFLMQFAASLWQACLFFGLAGLGCAACWAPVMAVMQRWIGDRRRGFILAMVDAGSTIGVMIAGMVIPVLISAGSWPLGWLVMGVFALVLGVLNFILIRDRPPAIHSTGKEPGRQASSGWLQLLSDYRFWLIGCSYLLIGFSIQIPFTFLSTYGVQELDLPYTTATRLITYIGIAGLLGKLTLGALSDKIGRIAIMVLCGLLIMTGSFGMAGWSGWRLTLAVVIFGVGYGSCWSMYAACASDFFSKASVGGTIGLWTVYLGIGLIISPVISGWSADLSGTLHQAFVMSASAGLGSALLLLPLWKHPRQ